MTRPFDGGPAFPCVLPTQDTTSDVARDFAFFGGMTLRHHFATQAMHAELMTCGTSGDACDALIAAANAADRTPEQQVAWNAYRMADAMIAAGEMEA